MNIKWIMTLPLSWMLFAATPLLAIENGSPDHAHRNVGILGIDFDGIDGPWPPFALCTGFVISDSAFVTAAHCIDVLPVASWAVSLEAGTPEDPVYPPGIVSLATFNITDFPLLTETVYADAAHYHPAYDADTLVNDIAVLEFPHGTFDVPPVRLAEEGFLDEMQERRSLEHTPITLVGYGASGAISELEFVVSGYRQWGFGSMDLIDDVRADARPSSKFDAATRPADSGSPQFIFGRAVSLTSAGFFLRLDNPAVLDFLADFAD